uniref:Uncharacterized protein n=1 Tax=Aegilops tauschii subsp. strangulata TaxID=200361 RepID=A0A453H353_AEGTS
KRECDPTRLFHRITTRFTNQSPVALDKLPAPHHHLPFPHLGLREPRHRRPCPTRPPPRGPTPRCATPPRQPATRTAAR